MRIRQLNLVRYGHFTDFTLDFGERQANSPDFHIIFGENEAGKSTAFNAYLDLLFGIEERSRFNFLHDYNLLRVSALLEMASGPIPLTRIKRRDANLLGVNDQPIDKEILASALHGLSREVYQTLFSLDDETLERGGEEILASKGDLGRLLFAGTAGVSDLSRVLDLARERAAKIYLERSHTCKIACLKNELKELDKERQALNTQTSTYERLTAASEKAEEDYQIVRKTLSNMREEQANLKIIQNAFQMWNALRVLENKLEAVMHLPEVPSGWGLEVKELQKKLAAVEQRQADALIEKNSALKQLESLIADPLILTLQDEIKAAMTLAAVECNARECLPKQRCESIELHIKLEELRERLGVNETVQLKSLVIPDERMILLDVLLQDEKKLIQCLKTAEHELYEAEGMLTQAQENENQTAEPDEKVRELSALSNRYEEVDAAQRLHQAEKAFSEKGRKIEQALKKLAPWKGDRESIKKIEVPTSLQANQWCTRVNGLQKELDKSHAQQVDLRLSHAEQEARVKAYLQQVGAISDVSATEARKMRNDAWAMHRAKLETQTADFFEKRLKEDDLIHEARLAATDRLAQLRIAQMQLAETHGKLSVIVDEIHRIDREFKALQDEIEMNIIKTGLPEDFSVVNLPKWIDYVDHARELIEEEHACKVEWEESKADYERLRGVLIAALTEVNKKPSDALDLRELCELAKTYQSHALKGEERHAAAKMATLQAKEQVRRRKQALELAEREFKKWQKEWEQALEGLWLKERKVLEIRLLLDPLRKIAQCVEREHVLSESISAHEAHCQVFQEAVSKLTRLLGIDEQNEADKQFNTLQGRLEKAKKIEIARQTAEKSLYDAEEKLEKSHAELIYIDKRIRQMAGHCGASESITTLDCLSLIFEQAKQKMELLKEISEKESHLLHYLGVKTRAQAAESLEAETPFGVETRLSKIEGDLQETERVLEKKIEERRDALQAIEAIGGDARRVRLEEKRQSILSEIVKNANQSLALHLGLMAADRALAAYRDIHRSELLTQTAEAFRAITAGEFSHLNTQPDPSGDQLVAVRANQRSITAEKMSKGTRFQLYLALRLAGYRRFCNVVGPLPFIGDDIMETFDDRRSESAMRQLSESARNGQVIYFTHHRHLCDIAKSACESVRIHEIPKR